MPFILSIMMLNKLHNSPYKIGAMLWSLISFIPLGLFLYIVYFALTCGNGCFSGIFFLVSIGLAGPLLLINAFIFFNISDRYTTLSPELNKQIKSSALIQPIYTPLQVFLGSILGGYIATIYFLSKNYDSFGESRNKYLMIVFGIIFVFFLGLISMKSSTKIFSLVYMATSLFAAIYTYIALKRRAFPLTSLLFMSHSIDKTLTHTFKEWIFGIFLGWLGIFAIGFIMKLFS
jgi:hypothetical protein